MIIEEDKQFFGADFIGTPISFDNPESHWVLCEKLQEQNTQLIPEEAIDFPSFRGAAYGTFLAQNLDDASQEAVIRVILQVPGTSGAIAPGEIARQAVKTIPTEGQDMLDALTALKDAQCKSAPMLLDVVHKEQSGTDPVPGGFFTCLLLEKLPGRKMGPRFWDLDPGEREMIRACFKDAWIECARASRYFLIPSPSKMFWDAGTRRIAFYDFLTGNRWDTIPPWKDVCFIFWGLAKPPPQFGSWGIQPEHSDMTDWTL